MMKNPKEGGGEEQQGAGKKKGGKTTGATEEEAKMAAKPAQKAFEKYMLKKQQKLDKEVKNRLGLAPSEHAAASATKLIRSIAKEQMEGTRKDAARKGARRGWRRSEPSPSPDADGQQRRPHGRSSRHRRRSRWGQPRGLARLSPQARMGLQSRRLPVSHGKERAPYTVSPRLTALL